MDEPCNALTQAANEAHTVGIGPDPADLASPAKIATPDGLLAALLGGDRYVVVTGPSQSGKTRMLDELVPRLAGNDVRTIRVENPDAGPLSLKRLLSGVLAMTPEPESLPEEAAANACETIMFPAAEERATVLVVDDAHTLQADALHMLDLVSGPAAHRVQVLLVGRPTLRDVLRAEGPAGLLDRIGAEHILGRAATARDVCLPPLSRAAVTVARRGHAWRIRLLGFAVVLAGAGAVGIGRRAWPPDTMPAAAVAMMAPTPVPSSQPAPAKPDVKTENTATSAAASGAASTDSDRGGLLGAPAPDSPVPERPQPAASDPIKAPVAPPPPASAARALPVATLTAMRARADGLLAIGDVSAARLLYERAAAAGDAAAAAYAGRTYDPHVLASLGTIGFRPDAGAAASWYRRAISMGHREAEQWLETLERAGR